MQVIEGQDLELEYERKKATRSTFTQMPMIGLMVGYERG